MRIVADSNTLVSAALWGGLPSSLFELAWRERLELWTSRQILEETDAVIRRPRFRARLAEIRRTPAAIMRDFRKRMDCVSPADMAPTARDPDDDLVLATALSARAHTIVSGDKDLLVLKNFRGIPILMVRAFFERHFPDMRQRSTGK